MIVPPDDKGPVPGTTPRRVALPGGRVLLVRPVRADDVGGLAALYAGLDDDSRYRRFFSNYRPARPFFDRMVAVGERGGAGLVATVIDEADGGERIVGEAGYELLPNGDGELAISVDAAWRGWLGPYLLDALVDAAASRGVPNLEADVLATNGQMLALLRSRGYATRPNQDWTVVRALIGTATPVPRWPDAHHGLRVLVEGGGSHWPPRAPPRPRGSTCCSARGRPVAARGALSSPASRARWRRAPTPSSSRTPRTPTTGAP